MISLARTEFLSRIETVRFALDENILIDNDLIYNEHNQRAKMLRNGLAIIQFNILEDFIKKRIEEVLRHITQTRIAFEALPIRMQEVTLLGSMKGIMTVAKRMKSENQDWKLFIQNEAIKISSTLNYPFQLTHYGFGYENSNIGVDDLSTFFNVFQITEGFTKIHQLTQIIGCSLIAPKDFFHAAARRRHSAAHDPTTNVSYTDMETYLVFVKSLALAFDFLISWAAHLIKNNNTEYIINNRPIIVNDLNIRYIRKVGNLFKEMSVHNTICLINHNSEIDAVNSIVGRRNYRNELIAVIDYPNKVYSWYTSL